MPSHSEQLLIERYQKRLPEKIKDIKQVVDTNDLFSAQLQLHKLAGSAGMYGFESISSLSAQLETIILSGQSVQSIEFQTLFEALCAEVNESQNGA